MSPRTVMNTAGLDKLKSYGMFCREVGSGYSVGSRVQLRTGRAESTRSIVWQTSSKTEW